MNGFIYLKMQNKAVLALSEAKNVPTIAISGVF